MNKTLTKIALDASLINYVDNETPRRYFINGNADLEEVQEFAENVIAEFIAFLTENDQLKDSLTTACIATDFFEDN